MVFMVLLTRDPFDDLPDPFDSRYYGLYKNSHSYHPWLYYTMRGYLQGGMIHGIKSYRCNSYPKKHKEIY